MAGCAEPGHGPAGTDAPQAASPAAPATGPSHPARLELTGCTGWDGHSAPVPRAAAPWPAPAGWEPDDPTVAYAAVFLAGYECQRLSIGPFERGPVRLLYDGHNNADVPEACLPARGGFTGDVAVLNSVWVDDPELARYFRETLGLPAHASTITVTAEDAGAARLRTWTWGDGNGSSTLTHVDDGLAGPDARPSHLFWTNGDGIAALALSYDREGSAVTGRPSQGTMEPPMLLSDAPQGAALAATRWYPPFPASGAFTRYADTLCTQPEA